MGRRIAAVLCALGLLVTGLTAVTWAPRAEAAILGTVLYPPASGPNPYACYRIPSIVRTNEGTLLAFAQGREDSCADLGEAGLVVRRSIDNGATWSDIKIIAKDRDPGGTSRAGWMNPVPIVDRAGDRITVLASEGLPGDVRTVHRLVSVNDGVDFTLPECIQVEPSVPGCAGGHLDLAGWSVQTGPAHGIQLQRGDHPGRMVAPVWAMSPAGALALIYSDDAGRTWQRGATYRPVNGVQAQEANLFERNNGDIYVMARDNNGGEVAGYDKSRAVSADEGETFTGPFLNVTTLLAPNVQGAVLQLRSTDDGDDYNRVLFSSPSDGRTRMMIRSSYNEGANWTGVDDGGVIYTEKAAYSDMVELANGRIGILYERGTVDTYERIVFNHFFESDIGLPN